MNKVDIILPNFNSGVFLHDCFKAITAQSLTNFKVYVIDNGSTDDSIAIIESWMKKDDRISLTINNKNIGAMGSIVKGFQLGEADYAMLLPADDRIEPDFLKLTVAALDENTTAAFAYTASKMVVVDEQQHVLSESLRFVPHYESGCYFEITSLMVNYYTGIPLLRKSTYDDLGGINVTMPQTGDYDYSLRASALYPSVYINSVQQYSLKHDKQLSKVFYKNGVAFWDFNKVYRRLFEDETLPLSLRLFAQTVEYAKFTGKTIVDIAQSLINSPEPTYRNMMLAHQDDYLYCCVEAVLSQYHLRGVYENKSTGSTELKGRYGSVDEAASIANYLLSRQHKKIKSLLDYHHLSLS